MAKRDSLGEVVGVEKSLFFLLIEKVGGRALKTHGRIIQLGQFSLARQQTVSGPKISETHLGAAQTALHLSFTNKYSRDLIVLRPEKLVAEHEV